MKKILIFGSPCTFWSAARKDGREIEPSGIGWELFKNCVIAKEKFNPNYFLYENNKSINQSIKNAISNAFGVTNMTIDAGLVSAQHREREYWFNWDCKQPIDLHVDSKSILDNPNGYLINTCADGKVRTIKADYYKQGMANFITNGGHGATAVAELRNPQECESQYDENGCRKRNNYNIGYKVCDGMIDVGGKKYSLNLPDGIYSIRKLSPKEVERLQCLPEDYTNVNISDTNRYKGIGNGWCVNIVEYILKEGLKNIPKDEEIEVVSLYDGIGTGRLILDRLGFTNVKYFAYEIDASAIKIATINHPDIIECGDAFALRTNNWCLPL